MAGMADISLLTFVKDLLGFYGNDSDELLSTLIIGAERYIAGAGMRKPVLPTDPTPEQTAVYESATALYHMAVAVRVKTLHDGDPKGDMAAVLTGIIAQARAGD